MKETWINKLVELLNEYEIEKATRDYTRRIEKQNKIWICWTEYTWAYVDDEETERIVISKKYKFIEWLVKHFKLNISKIDARIALSDFNTTDRMLMALAISDNPIALLIDCLK